MDPESQMLEDFKQQRPVDLERAIFLASGRVSEAEISCYVSLLDDFQDMFHEYAEWFDRTPVKEHELRMKQDVADYVQALLEDGDFGESEKESEEQSCKSEIEMNLSRYESVWSDDLKRAFVLHNFLWNNKCRRYTKPEDCSFADAIDAQSDQEDSPVGDCFDLTTLFSVLALREGLDVEVLDLDEIDDDGEDHIMVKLNDPTGGTMIETTAKFHFIDYEEHMGAVNEFGPSFLVAQTYYTWGIIEGCAGNHDHAIEMYARSLIVSPDYFDALIGRAYSKIYTEDYDGAIRDLVSAMWQCEDNPRLWHNLAIAHDRRGDLEDALICCSEAIELGSRDASLYVISSDLKLDLGDRDGALFDADTAIHLDPTLYEAHSNRDEILGL